MIYSPETRKLVAKASAAKRKERKAQAEVRRAIKIERGATTGVNGLRQRDPREKDAGYLAWLHTKPCAACRALKVLQKTPTEAAHPKFGIGGKRREFGLSEKSHDRYAVPLCGGHHRILNTAEHNKGQRRFWDELGIDVEAFAEALFAEYEARQIPQPESPHDR